MRKPRLCSGVSPSPHAASQVVGILHANNYRDMEVDRRGGGMLRRLEEACLEVVHGCWS